MKTKDMKAPFSSKIDTKVIDRVTNLALCGQTDDEIIKMLSAEINDITVTERWVRFLATQARWSMEPNNIVQFFPRICYIRLIGQQRQPEHNSDRGSSL